jgi:uncharacterized protein (UPF0332 family)
MNPLLINAFEKAEDSFEDAQLLFSHGRYAGCINRCYYSVFYLAYAMLLLKGVHTKTHNGVIRKFSELYIQTKIFPKSLIITYREIFRNRQTVDYDMDSHVNEEETKKVLAGTREFLDAIKKI